MKKIAIVLSILGLVLTWNACKKPQQGPPVKALFGWTKYSVKQLTAIATCTTCENRFVRDSYFTGVIIADEVSGNFYKEVYVRDTYDNGFSGGAIHLSFTAGKCNFFIGDSIRMNLKDYDINVSSVTGILEIDSIDFEKAVVKYGTGPSPKPIQLKLSDLSSTNPFSNYYGDLITINEVSFIAADTNKIYADPISQLSFNRTIQDCNKNQLIVRTSNYANFAQERTPKGFGSITGIATAYRGTNQMAIRNTNEVNMTGTGCTIYLDKDFDDNQLTSGGWTQQSVVNPSILWLASSFSGVYFAKISGYTTSNQNSEAWLISPAFNLSKAINPILSFVTAAKFTGLALEVWVSTNYSAGLPSTAAWTQLTGFSLSPNNSTSNYVWTPSGDISLTNYKTANVRVAFKYKSTTSGSSTYEVDAVIVKEK
jgi:Family of unknown function (DUF5689)